MTLLRLRSRIRARSSQLRARRRTLITVRYSTYSGWSGLKGTPLRLRLISRIEISAGWRETAAKRLRPAPAAGNITFVYVTGGGRGTLVNCGLPWLRAEALSRNRSER